MYKVILYDETCYIYAARVYARNECGKTLNRNKKLLSFIENTVLFHHNTKSYISS